MKIVLTAREVEDAIIRHMRELHAIEVKTEHIKWTESEIIHPVYPITIEVKS